MQHFDLSNVAEGQTLPCRLAGKRGSYTSKNGHGEQILHALSWFYKARWRPGEAEGHHPDISFGWGYTTVSLQTKKIKGLHENDFIMAAKLDQLAHMAAKLDQLAHAGLTTRPTESMNSATALVASDKQLTHCMD